MIFTGSPRRTVLELTELSSINKNSLDDTGIYSMKLVEFTFGPVVTLN